MRKVVLTLVALGYLNAFPEKVHRFGGYNATQSPNGDFGAVLDTSIRSIKIIRMKDSTLLDNLNQCGKSDGNLATWASDSEFVFFQLEEDFVSLYGYSLKQRQLIQFGRQSIDTQHFSSSIAKMQNSGTLSLKALSARLGVFSIKTGASCDDSLFDNKQNWRKISGKGIADVVKSRSDEFMISNGVKIENAKMSYFHNINNYYIHYGLNNSGYEGIGIVAIRKKDSKVIGISLNR